MKHLTLISEKATSGGAGNLPWGFLVMQVILVALELVKDP